MNVESMMTELQVRLVVL